MAAVYNLIVREEQIMMEERKRDNQNVNSKGRDEEIELVIPPVFENCTRILEAEKQIEARDLYWEAVCEYGKIGLDEAEKLLLKSIEKNPFVGEPHVVVAQLYLGKGRYEEAEREARKGLTLVLEWGSTWDKRMSWEGWVAWGILNLGLVN